MWWVQSISIQARIRSSNHSINAFEKRLNRKKQTSSESLIQLSLDFRAWIDPKIVLIFDKLLPKPSIRWSVYWSQEFKSANQLKRSRTVCSLALYKGHNHLWFGWFFRENKTKSFVLGYTIYKIEEKMNSYANQSCVKVGHIWNNILNTAPVCDIWHKIQTINYTIFIIPFYLTGDKISYW